MLEEYHISFAAILIVGARGIDAKRTLYRVAHRTIAPTELPGKLPFL